MNVLRGDVVLLNLPFASSTDAKVRPAVVVQSDRNNRRLTTTIVAPVTSNLHNVAEPTQVRIDVNSPDGIQTGLLRPSAIKCENLATVVRREIRRHIGTLSPRLIQELNEALRAALELR